MDAGRPCFQAGGGAGAAAGAWACAIDATAASAELTMVAQRRCLWMIFIWFVSYLFLAQQRYYRCGGRDIRVVPTTPCPDILGYAPAQAANQTWKQPYTRESQWNFIETLIGSQSRHTRLPYLEYLIHSVALR